MQKTVFSQTAVIWIANYPDCYLALKSYDLTYSCVDWFVSYFVPNCALPECIQNKLTSDNKFISIKKHRKENVRVLEYMKIWEICPMKMA